jgi:hypothetical protein
VDKDSELVVSSVRVLEGYEIVVVPFVVLLVVAGTVGTICCALARPVG